MLFDENLLIEIFVKADDLCKNIEKELLFIVEFTLN